MKLTSVITQAFLIPFLIFTQNVRPAQSLNVILGDDNPLGAVVDIFCLFLSDSILCGDGGDEGLTDGQTLKIVTPAPTPEPTPQQSLTAVERLQNGLEVAANLLEILETVQGLGQGRGNNRKLRGTNKEANQGDELEVATM